jgi:hypothetical protein
LQPFKIFSATFRDISRDRTAYRLIKATAISVFELSALEGSTSCAGPPRASIGGQAGNAFRPADTGRWI